MTKEKFESEPVALAEFDVGEMRSLIDESRHAFLPSKRHPETTADDLFRLFVGDSEFRVLGYLQDGMPASYITALSDRARTDSLAIGPMYVGEEFRGRGLGRRQVEDFLALAKHRGYQTVFTKTWGENAASRAIFESLGFEIEAVRENDRVNGDATIDYLRRL